MTEDRVTFYFAYNSPYAFLASTRIEAALAGLGKTLDYKPFYSPRTGGGTPDFSSPKMQYLLEDIRRFAAAYELELAPGPFADTGQACRGFLFAADAGAGVAYHDLVYRARWLEGKDIGDAEILFAIADRCGLDRGGFRDAIAETSAYAEALLQIRAEAEADGAFGVPFFIYRGQNFWGNDRIEWLVRAIREDRAALAAGAG